MLDDNTFPSGPIAIDCEMVGVGRSDSSKLARVSIVDYDGNILYDVMCQPNGIVTNYRTRYSGVWPQHLENALPFDEVQGDVKRIIEVGSHFI